MDRIAEHLDIVFRRIQPECVLRSRADMFHTTDSRAIKARSTEISQECYVHYAHTVLNQYSIDEKENFYQDMLRCIDAVPANQSVFNLLQYFSQTTLRLLDGHVVCCAEKILPWRNISFLLGQDLFTTAFLAFSDAKAGRETHVFDWPSVIGTDDRRLNAVLQKGISENHFHLHGSTQVFSLAWMCLMNHPERIAAFLHDRQIRGRMAENLQDTVNLGELDAHLGWQERLSRAAALRQDLFKLSCLHADDIHFTGFNRTFMITAFSKAIHDIDILRFRHGAAYKQRNGHTACLDYAIDRNTDCTSAYRALAGERRLLYRSFLRIFRGEASREEQDALYLYLLVKAQFRNELIQVNGRPGFRNFAAYQDRKGDFWDRLQEYEAEALRMSVAGTTDSGVVQSLEMRIVPKMTSDENIHSIQLLDALIHIPESERHDRRLLSPEWAEPCFYVLHFIKTQDRPRQLEPFGVCTPRNADLRRRIRGQAKAVASALARNAYFCRRVRGIDAANVEIGCRPETFATEFRFLRQFIPAQPQHSVYAMKPFTPNIHVTYHAGEDVLDIVDGLRAIDEAVRFLGFQRGNRIGHALALGVTPAVHYNAKGCNIVLPKQIRLDDLVWILYRGRELGLSLDSACQWELRTEAEQLLMEIYGSWMDRINHTYSLQEYYQMWQLRGDAPELYSYNGFLAPSCLQTDPCEKYFLQDKPELSFLRNNPWIARLYYAYHFDKNVRLIGAQVISLEVDSWYQGLAKDLQQLLQRDLSEKGICIESNPSSNCLIGTFKKYERHPIFTFNRAYLDKDMGASTNSPQLSVSINTDDQGVFDTSLENEYALLAGALRKFEKEGQRIYTEDQIYLYLDHIRELGNLQTF